jgi:hypothetical protein
MSRTASTRTGFNITFTPDTLLGLTYRDFVDMLLEWHLLSFRRSPEEVAEEQLRQRQSQQAGTP